MMEVDEQIAEMKANHVPIMIIATEIDMKDDNKPRRYFRFPLDDGKWPMCYRSRMSHSAFAHSVKGRCYKPSKKNAEILYHNQHEDEFQWSQDNWKEACERNNIKYEKPELIEAENLWEFYKLIGYNYKKKKYDIGR
jgi:hypothetical protein